ncbi:enoyl-CoA hydratase-related protein [Nonomuraea sp. NPDC049750]|uniref:enoyl-CoA hydratase-related protein n=1 Tax=Nonomuraea sp. NPDC049750 TaxID=3154738 RepID=UPI0033DB3AC6
MAFRTLTVDDKDEIVTLAIDRPGVLNALSRQTLTELRRFLTGLTGFRGMILTGSGERAFVAGADIREMAAMTPEEGEEFGRLGQEVTRLIEAAPFPVIACVNGYALGGGCELAMACDYIYATADAVFGQPEVRLGLIPAFGGCVRLQRHVGPGRAREMIYTGRNVDAGEALRIGLVNRVFVTREEMLQAAYQSLALVSANSPIAVALCKEAVNDSRGREIGAALDIEAHAFRRTFTSEDMREGTQAFLSKRRPVFPGK